LPRFENRDAIVAEFAEKKPGLLLDTEGTHSVSLDWSAHGEATAEGLRFDLHVPLSPVGSVELNLPVDRSVAVQPDVCTVLGPLPAETGERRLWRIGFSGQAPLRLWVRRLAQAGSSAPSMTAKLETKQRLTPDGLEAEFTIHLEAIRQELRELECTFDPQLRPYRVSAPDLESWEILPAGAGIPTRLHIHLREPLRVGVLKVDCLAPWGSGEGKTAGWISPGLQVLHAVPRGEQLELRIHPAVRWENWRSGHYQLVKTTTESDGTRVLLLQGGGLVSEPSATGPPRPQAQIQVAGAEYRVRQLLWWQVQPPKSSLLCQLTCEAVRGQIFEIPVDLPSGWRVERVESNPANALQGWEVRPQQNGFRLVLDLKQSLGPPLPRDEAGSAARMTSLQLAVRLARQAADTSWEFPTLGLPEAVHPEGGLAISFDQRVYQVHPQSSAAATEPEEGGPWGNQKPELYYPYHGSVVRGMLQVQARASRLGLTCASEVVLASGRAAFLAHLVLQPEVGNPEVVELYVSAPSAARWEWKTIQGNNQVRSFAPAPDQALGFLGALGAFQPLEAVLPAAQAEHRAGGRRKWVLTLARPLREPLTLDAACEIAHREDGWEVPLLALPLPHHTEGTVTLYLAGGDLIQAKTDGLREADLLGTVPRGSTGSPWRTFRYGSPPFELHLQGRTITADPSSAVVIDRATLISYVERSGRQLHRYAFRVWNWRQRSLPLRLPLDAEILAARVDGRWIAQAAPGIRGDGRLFVELPVPVANPGSRTSQSGHFYEIVFAEKEQKPWHLWACLTTPPEILPVHPVNFRRTWRLAPGLVPLQEGRYRCLPGASSDQSPPDGSLPFPLASGWPPAHRWPLDSGWDAAQQQRMMDAASALAKASTAKPLTLRELLNRLASEPANGEPVLVDDEAFCAGSLDAETPMPLGPAREEPLWESLGLVYVPCRSGPILTTRLEYEIWQKANRTTHSRTVATQITLPESIEDAAAEAAAHGHDASGRFRTVADWLRNKEWSLGATEPNRGDSVDAVLGLLHAECWTEWEPIAADESGGTLIALRRDALPGLGIFLAAVFCIGFWSLPDRYSRPRLFALLLWLALSGLGYLWLSPALRVLAWWPWLGATAVALGWYVSAAARRYKTRTDLSHFSRPGSGSVPAATAVVFLAALGFWQLIPAHAEPDSSREPTVYLVREDMGKIIVLAAPELLQRLETEAKRNDLPASGAVLVAAEYTGKPVEDAIAFDAEFQVYCVGDGPTVVNLPLEGVQIQGETLLDGARAYPAAARAPRVGYSLKIEKNNSPWHRIRLQFRVPTTASGEEHEASWALPSLFVNHLKFDLPQGATDAQLLVGTAPVRGGQRLSSNPNGTRLEADLGRLSGPLRLRWLQVQKPARPPSVQVQEIYLWDLRPDTSTLTGVFRYNAGQGAMKTLSLDLPEGLEVLNVELPAVAGKGSVRLKDWRVLQTKGRRRLDLALLNPVLGSVTAILQFAPRRAFSSGQELPLPIPLEVQPSEGMLACQLEGLEADLDAHGLTLYDRQQFALLWKAAGRVDPRLPWLPAHAFTFHRGTSGDPHLKLQLRFAAPRVKATQQITWQLGTGVADLQAKAHLESSDRPLMLVEWQIPPAVTVTRLTGSSLQGWSQTGGKVQAWLEGTQRSADLALEGWATPASGDFQLPDLSLLTAPQVETWIRVRSADGTALQVVRSDKLLPLPDSRVSGPEVEFYTPQDHYAATLQRTRFPKTLETRTLTLAEVRGRQLLITALVDCQVQTNTAKPLTVHARNWPGGNIQFEPLEGITRAQSASAEGERIWTLHVDRSFRGRARFQLVGTVPLAQAASGLALPSVYVADAVPRERWVAVANSTLLQAKAVGGLEPAAEPGRALTDWADPLRRSVGSAWRVTGEDWRLNLVAPTQGPDTPAAQLVLADFESAVADGRHWLYQATYWIYHGANTDLTVILPSGAHLLTLAVDQTALTPLQPAPGRLWVPLPGGTGSSRLRLAWTFDEQTTLLRPRLQLPQIEGVENGSTLWTVHVPAGYQTAPPGKGYSPPSKVAKAASLPGFDLRRAEAQYRLSELMSGKLLGGDASLIQQLAASQRRFYEFCRDAERGLAASVVSEVGPRGQSLEDWLRELREQNRQLARQQGFEAVRAEAERAVSESTSVKAGSTETSTQTLGPLAGPTAASPDAWPDNLVPRRGTPLYWQAAPEDAGPSLVLATQQARNTWHVLGISLVLVVLLASAWVVAQFPTARGWIRMFWPEQVALLGCLVWQTFGLNLVIVFLILLGICARLLGLGQWLWTSLRRSPASPPGSPAASAG
jgi:hypothetical protein